MRNIVNTYMDRFRHEKQVRRRTFTVLALLALLVIGLVFWQLRFTGVAMTNEVFCGMEEHVHSEEAGCYETQLICGLEEDDGHVHTEECYETMLVCEIPEHTHTVECLSNAEADVETAADWEATLPENLSGIWAEDVVSVAGSQLGYTESITNYQLAEDGVTHKGYTRYGAWYGSAYGDWDAMFAAFCLNYAGVDPETYTAHSGAYAWALDLDAQGLLEYPTESTPDPGDLVFFDTDGDQKADRVAVVTDWQTESLSEDSGDTADVLTVIGGDIEDAVSEKTYALVTVSGQGTTIAALPYYADQETLHDVVYGVESSDRAEQSLTVMGYWALPEQVGTEKESTQENVLSGGTEEEDKSKTESTSETEKANSADSTYQFEYLDDLSSLYEGDDMAVGGMSLRNSPEKASVSTLSDEDAEQEVNWYYLVYYVGQDDQYYVEKGADYSLKYQMEFHTSEDLPAGTVEIRIPAVLYTYRNGEDVEPSEIGVPYGTPDNPTYSSNTVMNYYYETDEDGTEYIVFWNYADIVSGSDIAWQVLYKDVQAMLTVDETEWELPSSAEVTVNREDPETGETIQVEQSQDGETLSGLVDTTTRITKITKTAYTESGKSYTPNLYTKDQVSSYVQYFTSDGYTIYTSEFDDYVYIVWEVSVAGTGNQPFTLEFLDETADENGVSGTVIGYEPILLTDVSFSYSESGSSEEGYFVAATNQESTSWSASFYVVTAYSKEDVQEGDVVKNTITGKITPEDGIDSPTYRSGSASTTDLDYRWIYNGDDIGVKKYEDETYDAYLKILENYMSNGRDLGTFPYTTLAACCGYDLTHHIDNDDPETLGEYIEGSYYKMTTVDDVLYAYTTNGSVSAEENMLSSEDYYFSQVTITRDEYSYDVWEDKELDTPETADNVDMDMTIYAMYAGESEWTEVAKVPFNGEHETVCTFTEEQLEKQPWRIKVEYNSINYETTCQIDVEVTLRASSEKIASLVLDENGEVAENITFLKIENISGVMGEKFEDGASQGYFHDSSVEGENYSEDGLIELSEELYGTLPQRDNAIKTLNGLVGTNDSKKTVTTSNDSVNARVLLTYNLAAYDGYYVYDYDTTTALKQMDVQSPGRYQVVFYDLLPYGVYYDASVAPVAGRILNISDYASRSSWGTAQVSITDVEQIGNWNGTGRTMVVFYVSYSGADSTSVSIVSNNPYNPEDTTTYWFEGWGVQFQAYYDWKDNEVAMSDENYNIFAFMPDSDSEPGTNQYNEDMRALLGTAYSDDGSIANTSDIYKDFGSADLNGDGVTDIGNVLYGSASFNTDIAMSSNSEIEKLVRADANVSADYSTEASVLPGEGYTYNITVNTTFGLSSLVICDRLEDGYSDHTADEYLDTDFFGSTYWTGTLVSVDTTALSLAGAAPVVYYNASWDAVFPGNTDSETGEMLTPDEVLTKENGWYTEEDFIETYGSLSAAKSIAVDIRTAQDGSEFELGDAESVSFQIHMLAPENVPEGEDGEIIYAYNNSYYYSTATYTNDTALVQGNTVRVSEGNAYTYILEKQMDNSVPASVSGTQFEFHLTLGSTGQDYSERIYTLWAQDEDGNWGQILGSYATDYNGYLYLYAGQRAVFSDITSVEMKDILAEETGSVYWSSSGSSVEAENDSVVTCTVTNTYHPPLYITKSLSAVPDDVDTSDYEFTVQVFVENENGELVPYANEAYWLVSAASTNGSEPEKLGEGVTDSNGCLTLHGGETAAFFLPSAGLKYRIVETETGEDFFTNISEQSGTVAERGTSVTITNIYEWKDLSIAKALTHQDAADCDQEFTFQILQVMEDGTMKPVTGLTWEMVDSSGSPVTDKSGDAVGGVLTETGTFTAACAGYTVIIHNLEAGETYLVKETDTGALYESTSGTVQVTMPIYSTGTGITYTNDYLMRDLSVTKYVADTSSEASDTEFTFTLTVNGEAAGGYAYTITEGGHSGSTIYYTDENGQFTLKSGQTAVFEDCGFLGDEFEVKETENEAFPQTYPENGESQSGTLSGDGSSVTFVNGTAGTMLITKEYDAADDLAREYLELLKEDASLREAASVTFTLKVNGEAWPAANTTVSAIDTLTGETSTLTWTTNGITVLPWVSIVIPTGTFNLSDTYVLTETVQDKMFEWTYDSSTSVWVQSEQSSPSLGSSAAGTVESDPVVTVINTLTAYKEEGSFVYKKMSLGSGDVPSGSKLVFVVERYDGESWTPAEGVAYLTYDNNGLTCNAVQFTGSDGVITLTKTDNGFPYIQFLEETVYLNLYENMKAGDYRIIEDTAATDEEWGEFVGYAYTTDEEDYSYGLDLDPTEAVAFVNSNRYTQFKVAKEVEEGSSTDQLFTFYLHQVFDTDSSGTVIDAEVAAGIGYAVYDSEGNYLRSGVTDAQGRFYLQAGQYALFEVDEGTVWIVSEGTQTGWNLKAMTGTEGETKKISDNAVEIFPSTQTEYLLLATSLYADDEVKTNDTLNKDMFDVWLYDSNGNLTNLDSSQFSIDPETASSSEGDMVVTITANESGAQAAVHVNVNLAYNVKYAVSIYGIEMDTYLDDNGNEQTAGLTFGPAKTTTASGNGYIDSYKAHISSKESMNLDNYEFCIHWLTWEQIAEYSKMMSDESVDETVRDAIRASFQTCQNNMCTHSVDIVLNSTLLNTSYEGKMDDGDGASMLYNSLKTNYRRWNSGTNNSGGWPASNIRAVMNGIDEYSDSSVSTGLTEENCLLSCFPGDLQNAIVARAVSSNTVYNSVDTDNVVTTYDRLWAFSCCELNCSVSGNLSLEGSPYSAVGSFGLYRVYNRNEDGTNCSWWLRSIPTSNSGYAYYIGNNGSETSYTTSSWGGIAPGFCLR